MQVAYQAALSKRIPVGSFARRVLQVACYRGAKTVTEQVAMEPLHEGKLVGLASMLVDRMTIQDTQVGREIGLEARSRPCCSGWFV